CAVLRRGLQNRSLLFDCSPEPSSAIDAAAGHDHRDGKSAPRDLACLFWIAEMIEVNLNAVGEAEGGIKDFGRRSRSERITQHSRNQLRAEVALARVRQNSKNPFLRAEFLRRARRRV